MIGLIEIELKFIIIDVLINLLMIYYLSLTGHQEQRFHRI
jgi:hypothetical protein